MSNAFDFTPPCSAMIGVDLRVSGRCDPTPVLKSAETPKAA